MTNNAAPKTLKAARDARQRIPGWTQILSKRPDQFSSGIWPGYFSRAKGVEVWDLDGNCYVDIHPDVAVFSKAMGNGYAIAAIIGHPDVMDAAQKTFISSTNWSERVGFAAGLATIRKHRRLNAADHLIAIGREVKTGWKQLADKHSLLLEIGGIDPMGHFTFITDAPQTAKAFFVQEMLRRGYLASNLFYAMFAHTPEHVAGYLRSVDEVFAELASGLQGGDLQQRLEGHPAAAGFVRLT